MHDDLELGRCEAPELVPWAAHVRWAVENDILYVLDLRQDRYLSLPVSKLRADATAMERQFNARGLLQAQTERPDLATAKAPRTGRAGFWSFWRAALWARSVMKRRDLVSAARLLSGAGAVVSARANDHVMRFRDWRPFYPRAASCLFDSLALGRFLWSAGVRSNLIYAVRGGPFSAHAWLEIGGSIINDDPEYCAGFTPMRGP